MTVRTRQSIEGALVGAIVGAMVSAAAYTVVVREDVAALKIQVQGVGDRVRDTNERVSRIEDNLLRGARQ